MLTLHLAPLLIRPMSKRSHKWIEGIGPDGAAAAAARKTLRRRLRAVWKMLQESVHRANESVEYVHQLRVSTRRAMAALQGYAELLPRRKAAKFEKRLKQIRRRAAAARDLDVMLERLTDRDDAERLMPLVERIALLRRAAQKPIVQLERKLRKRDFAGKIKRLVKKIRAPRQPRETTFQNWARIGLSRHVAAFFTAADGDLNDIQSLHAMRIEGKLLRYSIENFAAAFAPELRRDVYPEIERIQSLLGAVNDHAAAGAQYEAWRSQWTDAETAALLDELHAAENEALRAARQEFCRYWTPQRAADLKRRFAEILQLPGHEEVA